MTTPTTPSKCLGCAWDGYTHVHLDAEDGPRSTCCAHSCGRSDRFPTGRLARTSKGLRVVTL